MVGFSYQPMPAHDSTLEYLTTTKIGEKGQLTVPKEFRDDLGLENGAPVAVLRLGDWLILLPEQKRFERLCQKISERFARAGVKPEDVLATLPEVRDRLFAERYGQKAGAKVPKRRLPTARSK